MNFIEQLKEYFLKKLSLKDGSPTLYLLLAQGTEKAAFFLFFLLLARFVLKDVYGNIVSLFAFANLVATFFDFGLPFYLQRESARKAYSIRIQLRLALIAKLLVMPLFMAIVYFYAQSTDINKRVTIMISLSVYLFSLGSIFGAILLGKKQAKEYFFVLLGSRGSMILALLILLFTITNSFYFLYALPFGGIVYLYIILKYVPVLTSKEKTVYLKGVVTLIKRSIPLGLGALLVFIYDRIDLLLLEKLKNSSFAADYAIAYSLYKFPQIFSGAVLSPFFSEMSVYFSERSHFPIAEVFQRVKFILIISVLFLVFGYILAPYFVPGLYSEKYANSALVLQILVFGLPFLFLNNFTGVLLNAANREMAATKTVLAGAVFNILLNIAVIPEYGAKGAAYVTIATEFIILLLQLGFIAQFALLRREHP